MAAVPVAKVASLLVRTLAKPIATKLKKEAGRHPFLSKTSQVIGQQLHSITSRINVNTAGFKYVGVKPLPEEEALSKVAVSVVIVENMRSDYLAAIKKEKEATELKLKQDALERRFCSIEESIKEIEESLPTSSTWHLQKVRNLKLEAKAMQDLKKESEKELAKAALDEEERRKKAAKPLPSTPRAQRLRKAKTKNEKQQVSGANEQDNIQKYTEKASEES